MTAPRSGASRPASTRSSVVLPDAVRADDPEARAGADGDVDAVEHGERAASRARSRPTSENDERCQQA